MLTSEYSQFIHRSRYARWLEKEKRRETSEETVNRYIDFWKEESEHFEQYADTVKDYIYSLKVMPSMRALMTAGKALKRDNVAGYNCAYVAVDNQRVFDEILYILSCGTGIGYSVERQYIVKLPEIAEEFHEIETVITVTDSRIGWASSYRQLISLLFQGMIPKWDVSKVRPAGAVLKTFGGRASGPEPLENLFRYSVDLFKSAAGRKLNSIECHDLVCKIADIIIVGGVRRCLPEGYLVRTGENEYKEIQDLTVKDQVFLYDKYYKVLAVYDAGVNPLYKIKTEHGGYHISTIFHRWQCYDKEYKEVKFVNTKEIKEQPTRYNFVTDENKFIQITAVEDNKFWQTYDIEVENVNAFTAKEPTSGLESISHNSALISFSNLTDQRMRNAKDGQWWMIYPHRALANNSVCYTETPDIGIFMDEWKALYSSKSGERGIFNAEAVWNLLPERRKELNESNKLDLRSNPCSEIVLRNKQFCNLSEIIVRNSDGLEDLIEKAKVATVIGTFQSLLTNFRYLSSAWKRNCEEERLLGVSMTGIMDHPVLSGSEGTEKLQEFLTAIKETCIQTNKEVSSLLGINQSTAITAVKPSGNVSQLCNTASGIHPRYSKYYIRTVRSSKKDPLAKFMQLNNFPNEPDYMKPDSTLVFSFPQKSPDSSLVRTDLDAIKQLEIWKTYQLYYCEHKPSITVYVKEHEWLKVAAWVYDNFNILSGVSFLPWDNGTYKQAPYQECTKEEYEAFLEKMPKDVDWSGLARFEHDDNTEGSRQLACTAGSCEI